VSDTHLEDHLNDDVVAVAVVAVVRSGVVLVETWGSSGAADGEYLSPTVNLKLYLNSNLDLNKPGIASWHPTVNVHLNAKANGIGIRIELSGVFY